MNVGSVPSGGGEAVGSLATGGAGASPPATIAQVIPPPALASVALSGSSLSVQRNGQAAVKLTCTGTAASCSGQLSLTAKRVVRIAGRKRTRTVTLASVRFSIPSGRTSVVKLKLSTTARALLRALGGHLGATLAVDKTAPAPSQTLAKSVRLALVRRHGR